MTQLQHFKAHIQLIAVILKLASPNSNIFEWISENYFRTDEVGQTSSQMKKFVSTGSYGLTTKQFSTPLIDVTMALK